MNMMAMMQKAQQMQKKMAALQERMGDEIVQGSAGGGVVQVSMTCKGEMKSIVIDPSLLNPDEKDVLEDLIKAACNDARARGDKKIADETQQMMSGMGLPPGLLGGGGLPF